MHGERLRGRMHCDPCMRLVADDCLPLSGQPALDFKSDSTGGAMFNMLDAKMQDKVLHRHVDDFAALLLPVKC